MPVQPAESRYVTPYSAAVAGPAALNWGMKAVLQDIRESGFSLNASGAQAVPEGTTVESLAERLATLVSRHPALRVRLDTDDHGRDSLLVRDSGEIVVEVMDFDGADDPVEVGKYIDQLWLDWLMTPFDHSRDLPIRFGVIRYEGVPIYQVPCYNHLVIDGAAITMLMEEFSTGKPAGGTMHLLDLIEREQTPQALKANDRSLNYWESHLRDIPPRTFGGPVHADGRQGRRFWHARFNSPAAHLAVLALARRTGMDTSRVLFGVIATALGRAREMHTLTAKVISSNRFRPGLAEVIAPVAQNSLVSVELADATVDEVIARGRRALLAGGMHAYYDPDRLTGLMARLDDQRGYQAQVSCRINDRRMTNRQIIDELARTTEVTPRQIEERHPETWFSWDGTLDHLHEQAFITVEDHGDTLQLQLIFDMSCFTESQVENFVHGVEQVAVEAAFDPEAPAGIG
ncbi:condensation domain-containing protein [Jatrophihabitans sp.]|uniref:condensation domain-containing protein n=1 Tax=Jatrophihabitans sp. TaxID=1932789 RepID=UPI002B722337|nr:condensation domain-containing protein [Jatrophihabitans sp.]